MFDTSDRGGQQDFSIADKTKQDEQQIASLRRLLLGIDHQELQQLAALLDNKGLRSDFLAEVVSEALALRASRDNSVSQTLAPAITSALHDSIRDRPEVIANALYPVMGPAIRKSITETINSLFEGFNRALEDSLSPRSIGWRIDAMRTGRPYSEVVFLKTLLYRVEQVFLIHKETGLLIAQVAASTGVSKDADMMSGMLTAIQDFVIDSFEVDAAERLHTLKLGGLTILIEFGPDVVLAAAIRGSVPSWYVNKLVETQEHIQLMYRRQLAAFDGDSAVFNGLEPILRQCLDQQSASSVSKGPPWFALVASLLVAAVAAVFWYQQHQDQQRWAHFVEQVIQQPGVVVYDDRRSSKYLGALADAALELDTLTSEAAELGGQVVWKPFISTDDALVLARIHRSFELPGSLRLELKNGIVTLYGEASSDWIRQFRQSITLIAGVRGIMADHLDITDSAALQRQTLLQRINSTRLQFESGVAELSAQQRSRLGGLAREIQALQQLLSSTRQKLRVTLTGSADYTGDSSINIKLSKQRAANAVAALTDSGIDPAVIQADYSLNEYQPDKPAAELRVLTVAAVLYNPEEQSGP
jgi:flagellar motor protein MotB